MDVTYSNAVKDSDEQYVLLQKATKLLEEVLGGQASIVKSYWDRTEDEKGRTLYVMKLKDPYGEVTGAFAPAELQSANQMEFRLYRLWGDLLHAQTRKHLQAITGN